MLGGNRPERTGRTGRQPDDKPKNTAAAAQAGGEGGLLVSGPGKLTGRKFLFAIFMEFIGTGLFALFGNAAPPSFGAVGNGLTLAVMVYITANVSGGHLNPAVTIPTMMTGHISLIKGVLYIVAQISGAIVFTLLNVGLTPGTAVGVTGDACFRPGTDVTKGQAFGWELFMTFVLVSTVYAVAIGKPSYGNVGPLIVGVALWAMASSAGQYTTASLNPARTLGPAAVFHCYKGDFWYYCIAEVLGGVLAGLLSWPLYGTGPDHGKPLDSEFDIEPQDSIDMQEEAAANEERVSQMQRQRGNRSSHAVLHGSTQTPGGPPPPSGALLADRV